ncbi:hypothetical protein [Flammeovirga kamogawensis]|uniref:Uncharacterized protein n=1 Tax=Flammeovirga kamogawensis TaxID=373891 RepID=A0ABX8GW69_9BACT|nr:hypothetical protein [Flammeovirga kamogawensis]MBB6461287.1 hypothetical protein [Flammeovirga kamogawensis]QWG07846.1 hypothetical protein KM029_02575 [Flammeovirga kamogawensis]TRX69651.1 hypothetical protein EO216_16510 [Flammeovirga kamogawensis]
MFFFKRWSRKAYSVFNSLSKEIKICMLDIDLHFSIPVQEVLSFKTKFNVVNEDEFDEISLLIEPQEIATSTKNIDEEALSTFLANFHCYNQLLRTYFSQLFFSNSHLHFLCFTSVEKYRHCKPMPYLYYEK